MAALDLKQFRKDVKDAQSGRDAARPGRPATTGAMAIVRENLDLFDRMRGEDPTLTWSDIAASLGKQGVLQRDGQPITAKRLCALISTIRKQREVAKAVADARAARHDTAKSRIVQAADLSSGRRLKLSSELQRQTTTEPEDRTEDKIRAERFARHDNLFKRKD